MAQTLNVSPVPIACNLEALTAEEPLTARPWQVGYALTSKR